MTDRRPAKLLNVSSSGAMLEGFDLPPLDQDVMVDLGELSAFGTIIWRSYSTCGLLFDPPLLSKEMQQLQTAAQLRTGPRTGSLWSGARGVS